MNFRELEAFRTVAQTQSFSEAARLLYLSQPTVSEHVRQLEKELGTTLLRRTTRRVSLTEEGKQFLPYAERILRLRDTAMQSLRPNEQTPLQIGTSTFPSACLLPGLIARWHALVPETRFCIRQSDSSHVEEMVLDGVADLGFTGRLCQDSRIICRPLVRDRLMLVTPASGRYLRMREKNTPVRDILLQSPFLGRESGSGTGMAAAQILESMGIDPEALQIPVSTNDLESMREMIRQGLGVSILSELSVREMAENGQILLFPLPEDRNREFYLLQPGNREADPAVSRFAAFVCRVLAEEGAPSRTGLRKPDSPET